MFAAELARYEPQFGGYCAYDNSVNATVHGDPKQWSIVNDKLYVNTNIIAMRLWSSDRSGNIVKAERNWPMILKGPQKQPRDDYSRWALATNSFSAARLTVPGRTWRPTTTNRLGAELRSDS
jgi:hypothetical protein